MDNRRMCPQCRAFITNKDKVCPYCGEKVGPRAIDLRNSGEMLMGFIPSARFVTVMILLVDFALFAGSLAGNGTGLYAAGAERGFEVFRLHQWYRLVTAGYLHGGWLHIVMNSFALFSLAAQVEEVYGPPRFIVLFSVSSALGFLASGYFGSPMAASVGSSAGIMGLIGAMIALGLRTRNSMGDSIRGFYIRWAVYGLLFGLLPGIDNTAHIGGLASGFAVAYLAGTPKLVRTTGESVWRAAAGVCVAVTIFCFYQMYLHLAVIPQ
jgi:rhomboid protease GluP